MAKPVNTNPDHVYLTTNKETGTKRLVRAVGIVAARNHAADQLFEVERLSTGELLDVMANDGLKIETAGVPAQEEAPPEGQQAADQGDAKGGNDGDEK